MSGLKPTPAARYPSRLRKFSASSEEGLSANWLPVSGISCRFEAFDLVLPWYYGFMGNVLPG